MRRSGFDVDQIADTLAAVISDPELQKAYVFEANVESVNLTGIGLRNILGVYYEICGDSRYSPSLSLTMWRRLVASESPFEKAKSALSLSIKIKRGFV